jgi:hypothetical protein
LVVVSKEEEIAQFEEGDTDVEVARSNWSVEALEPTKHLCLNLPQVRASTMLFIDSCGEGYGESMQRIAYALPDAQYKVSKGSVKSFASCVQKHLPVRAKGDRVSGEVCQLGNCAACKEDQPLTP